MNHKKIISDINKKITTLMQSGYLLKITNSFSWFRMEATKGFEPPNSDFADRRLRPLGYVAIFAKIL